MNLSVDGEAGMSTMDGDDAAADLVRLEAALERIASVAARPVAAVDNSAVVGRLDAMIGRLRSVLDEEEKE